MSKLFAICDLNKAYVRNLMQYINSHQSIPLKMQAFTSPELLKEFAAEHDIELLLISAEAMDEEIAALPIGKIVVLAEDGVIDMKGFPSVNRYQASGNLVQEVMQYYSAGNMAVACSVLKLAATRLTGVYSPVRRCGKTAFALAYGQACAKDRKTLYVNLEDFSGFSTLFGQEFRTDISDLLYFFREERQAILEKLEEAVQKLDNLYYLPPAMCPADRKEVQPEEWRELFLLLMQSRYEVIIVEPGDGLNGLEEILSLCDRIYVPVLEDRISEAKLKQYEDCLLLSGWDSLTARMKRLMVPEYNSREGAGLSEYIEAEEMKRFAEHVLWEEEHG